MTEENLETKAKRTYKLYELIGIAGMAAIGFGFVTGLSSYYKGHSEGYDEGKKAGVEEGKEVGVAEFQENNSVNVWVGGAIEPGYIAFELNKVDEQGKRIFYTAATRPETFENITVITGDDSIVYLDGIGLWSDEWLEINGEHDGIVDAIAKCHNGECTTLVRGDEVACYQRGSTCVPRASDYEEHKAEFNAADAEFLRLKELMSFI